MHDPSTQAFQIKYPWKRRPSQFWPNGYRDTFITIWHRDPEISRGRICRRRDDTCGWFSPNPSEKEYEAVRKLAKEQYRQIFERQVREAEGADYAYVCNEPTILEAVYWSWRAIKRFKKYSPKRVMWQYAYGVSQREFEEIFCLASNPVDNLKHLFRGVKDEAGFISFFFCVYNAYARHSRPWYRHPRWHVHHWRIQFHPWQNIRRRFWDKCCRCGKRGFKPEHGGACGNWSGTELWHSSCDGINRAQVGAAAQKEAA
jgi:hypothetical protein